MDKNKSLYISLVVLFCVVITGISAFFLGLQFSKQKLVDITMKNESKIINVDSYNIPTLSILYNYFVDSAKILAFCPSEKNKTQNPIKSPASPR